MARPQSLLPLALVLAIVIGPAGPTASVSAAVPAPACLVVLLLGCLLVLVLALAHLLMLVDITLHDLVSVDQYFQAYIVPEEPPLASVARDFHFPQLELPVSVVLLPLCACDCGSSSVFDVQPYPR